MSQKKPNADHEHDAKSAPPDLAFTSVAEQARLVASGTITARELTEFTLSRIARLNPRLNAFAWVLTDEARVEADALDKLQAAGTLVGPLHGVPIAIKDENDVAGLPTAYGGAAVTRVAEADSEVVRLLRAAGAVIIGKTRMPEFGIWPFTETSANGYTRNPWNPLRSTAGSSGGTAAAVASGMVAAAIGGDGGGSIRLPSSFCGLYGLKPQRGRVSAAPNANLWRALGTIGPLTRTVADSALIYDVIAGTTAADQFSAGPFANRLSDAVSAPFAPLRIAISAKNPGGRRKADPETLRALHETAAALKQLGHTVVEIDPKYPSLGLPFLFQVMGGVSDEAARVDHPELLEKRTRTLVKLSKPFLRFGTWAERKAAEKSEAFNSSFFGYYDLILMPTTPTPAVPIGQLDGTGAFAAFGKATPAASFTSIWNTLGNPAAAIPTGFSEDGLPLSAQLVAAPNAEATIVQVSAQLESARPWAWQRPAIS